MLTHRDRFQPGRRRNLNSASTDNAENSETAREADVVGEALKRSR